MITAERAMAIRMAEADAVWRAVEQCVPDKDVQLAIRRAVVVNFDALTRRGVQQLPPAETADAAE
jgi:hypothetical protein